MQITEPREHIPVAVGVVRDYKGRVLVGQRPDTKDYAGKWEFPGGKVKPGETIFNALVREFWEELGLKIITATPAFMVRHDYPEYSIELHIWRVINSYGNARGLEGQLITWVAPRALFELDFLSANQQIVQRIIDED